MSEEYYEFLVHAIAAVGQDPTQLRMMIYQLARSELRKELYARRDFRWAELKQQMSALERAIEQVELDVTNRTMRLTTFSPVAGAANQNAVARLGNTALVVHENLAGLQRVIEQIEPDVHESRTASRFDPVGAFKPIRAAFWSTVRLIVPVIMGVGLFTAMENHGDLLSLLARYGRGDGAKARQIADVHLGQGTMQAAGNPNVPLGAKRPLFESDANLSLQMKNVPIPDAYGVYAIDHGKLMDLESLPIRVPDQRVGISALFSSPSGNTLSDGRLQFIAFRRDLANNAPDRVMVRVVARVMRALTFDAKGNASLTDINASWAVRSNAYEMKVAPVDGSPEMIIIRPENPTFSFPAGRYALVLQGSAYDFSVAGPITDTAQCLERTDALNMPVYTECRSL
jgi:hypothetical protein